MKRKLSVIYQLLFRRIFFLSILFTVGMTSKLYAQKTFKVSGTIVDEEQAPIPGVNVLIKGSTIGTVTDFDGNYNIMVYDKNSILVFSYIGYKPVEVEVSKKSEINLQMEVDTETLEEVVVIGYGQQEKREVTGSVAQVKSDQINTLATSDLGTAIQGQMAGVSVSSASGAPGENATITVRGVSSFQEGGSEPLYVVDGVTYTSNPNLSPQEIESVEVLKDGASAAIYGSRASAGVILITTKRGEKGKMLVTLDSYYGVQKITSDVHLANTTDAMYINHLMWKGDPSTPNPLENNPNAMHYNTDWLKELQVDMAPIQNHALRLSGGSKNLTYSIVGTLFDQQGIQISSAYQRKTLRANTTFEKNKLKVQINMGYQNSYKDNPPNNIQYQALRQDPFRPGIQQSDEYVIEGSNPERMTNLLARINETNETRGNNYNGNAKITYELAKGLKLNANIGGSYGINNDVWFSPTFDVYNNNGEYITRASKPLNELRYIDTYSLRTIQEYTATYSKKWGKHHVSLLAGNTWETAEANRRTVHAINMPNNIPNLGVAQDVRGIDQRYTASSNIGVLGRVQYSYDGKYMVSASVRSDGSSRFHPSNNWGTFKSFSAGWNISEEKFFEALKPTISSLKIRGGYGETGSDKAGQGLGNLIADLPYVAIVTPQIDYVLGIGEDDILYPGTSNPTYVDEDITWETNISQNIGLDGELFAGRLFFNFDLYRSEKKDMLLPVELPPSAGGTVTGNYNKMWQNVGNLTNEGIELGLGYNTDIKKLKLTVNGTFTRNFNKVTELAPTMESVPGGRPLGNSSEPTTFLIPGYEAGAFFLIPTEGTIKTNEELEEYQKMIPTAKLGDLKYVDVNGDGEIDQNDRVYQGSGTPLWEAGLSVNLAYKGFDLSVMLFGSYGAKIYNGTKAYAYQQKTSKELVNAWSPENPTSNVPTPRRSSSHMNVRTYSDYFLEDGSYLKIQNITFGYTLSDKTIRKLKMNNFRVYVSAQNPFVFTNYSGYDPEIGSKNVFYRGVDTGKYPVAATYRAGLSLQF
ncbi:SusC/RagA family TonB-linked outer membrane protein [Flammeovirga agarivorans]|uniref:TonB-dependent receptor n=1 Tax=Flammeovirga agarivorans TaxID=2726742 RepID=A0A7X8SKE8_9BACT|nr:TonB-dependent receptor [Flammeovirga agarivorans]NLR91836.1 TonB-dependent receptor [Flammeovirga agarivorans]